MTGGGSGGHITPILAVAHELKQIDPTCQTIYVGQQGDSLLDMPRNNPDITAVHVISAGKLRRYSTLGWRQYIMLKIQLRNVRDLFRTCRGIVQSLRLLRRERPDVVFCKGGFVGVPVGVAAAVLRIPYVTHDSDVVPGLANRLIARWASLHAVALPTELYPYPVEKTRTVGVPVGAHYRPVTPALNEKYRQSVGVLPDDQVLLVTGGGNGAQDLNEIMVDNARYMLREVPQLVILHVAGRRLEAETNAAYDALNLGAARKRVQVLGFMENFYEYSGAADVVVARGGATNLAEFALQSKACLLVPSEQLSWNVKNSEALAAQGAVLLLTEAQADQPERLGRAVEQLFEDKTLRSRLGERLATIARPEAARDLAELIIGCAEKGRRL